MISYCTNISVLYCTVYFSQLITSLSYCNIYISITALTQCLTPATCCCSTTGTYINREDEEEAQQRLPVEGLLHLGQSAHPLPALVRLPLAFM